MSNNITNLTKDKRIVFTAQDTNPIPNHALVIYKKVGQGQVHVTTLPPGESFKPNFLERCFTVVGYTHFVAYAVNYDDQLSFTFTHDIKHSDHLHSFSLNFHLKYRVKNPMRLVDRLDSDPLSRLQEEAVKIVGSAVTSLPWFKVKEAISLREETSLQSTSSGFDELENFANNLGLELLEINFTHSIPDNHLEAERAVEAAKTSEIINTAQHNPKKQAKQYEKELEKIEDRAEVEKVFVRASIDDYNRMKKFKDAIADSAAKAIDNVADNVAEKLGFLNGDDMSNEQGRRQQEIERLQKLWKELTEKLNALQRERNFETRIEEKLRLGKLIDDAREDRAQIDNELCELESNFGCKLDSKESYSKDTKDKPSATNGPKVRITGNQVRRDITINF